MIEAYALAYYETHLITHVVLEARTPRFIVYTNICCNNSFLNYFLPSGVSIQGLVAKPEQSDILTRASSFVNMQRHCNQIYIKMG